MSRPAMPSDDAGLSAPLLLSWLAGCSAVRLAYNQAPAAELYWWLDGYVDFNAEQAPAVTRGPRRAGSPGTVPPNCPTTPRCWCRPQTDVAEPDDAGAGLPLAARAARRARAGARAALALARPSWCRRCAEPQLQQLERRYRQGDDELRDDFLQADPRRAPRRRRSSARCERVETLYGSLDEAQRAAARRTARRLAVRSRALARRAAARASARSLQTLRRCVAAACRAATQRVAALRALAAALRALARPGLPRLPAAAVRLQLRLRRAPAQQHHAGAAPQARATSSRAGKTTCAPWPAARRGRGVAQLTAPAAR